MSLSRRFLLQAGLPALAFAAAPALLRAAPPQQQLLRVELRSVPLAAAATGLPPGLKPGSVVVGTSVNSAPRPGSVTLRSSSAAPAEAATALIEAVVANGERARVRWQDERLLQQVDLVWTGPTAAAGAASAGGQAASASIGGGQGLSSRSERRVAERVLEVRPRWPGGNRPVLLTLALNQTPGLDAGERSSPGLSVETTLSVPLDQWVQVARSQDPAAAPGALPPAAAGIAIEVRVSLAGR